PSFDIEASDSIPDPPVPVKPLPPDPPLPAVPVPPSDELPPAPDGTSIDGVPPHAARVSPRTEAALRSAARGNIAWVMSLALVRIGPVPRVTWAGFGKSRRCTGWHCSNRHRPCRSGRTVST